MRKGAKECQNQYGSRNGMGKKYHGPSSEMIRDCIRLSSSIGPRTKALVRGADFHEFFGHFVPRLPLPEKIYAIKPPPKIFSAVYWVIIRKQWKTASFNGHSFQKQPNIFPVLFFWTLSPHHFEGGWLRNRRIGVFYSWPDCPCKNQ